MSNILKNLAVSSLGLKGLTPKKREGALGEKSIHSPVLDQNSILDLNGKTPEKYLGKLE